MSSPETQTAETAETPAAEHDPKRGQQEQQIDLKAFFRHVGGGIRSSGAESAVDERPEPTNPAELIDTKPALITGVEPIAVAGFVDGIQATMRAAYREHRPVILHHVAAGCLSPDGRPLAVRETLSAVCAEPEREWIEAANSGVPVEVVDAPDPSAVERRAAELLVGKREHLEKDVTEVMLRALDRATLKTRNSQIGGGAVVVDGSVVGRTDDPRIIGVVKTTRTRYLLDETILYDLEEGWRSPRFKLAGPGGYRYSAYVRLFNATWQAWDFGLIRIEANNPEAIDAAASMAMQYRLAPGSDGRWDRHLAGVLNTERWLRARRPTVFG